MIMIFFLCAAMDKKYLVIELSANRERSKLTCNLTVLGNFIVIYLQINFLISNSRN